MLEVLFRDVVDAVSTNETLRLVLQSSNLSKKTKSVLEEGGVQASMSAVNNALKDKTFQSAAWETLEIDSEVSFPNLYGDTIYGDLSASIHSPALTGVFVSNHASRGDLAFFEAIAARSRPPKAILVFKEEFAAMGANFPPFLPSEL